MSYFWGFSCNGLFIVNHGFEYWSSANPCPERERPRRKLVCQFSQDNIRNAELHSRLVLFEKPEIRCPGILVRHSPNDVRVKDYSC